MIQDITPHEYNNAFCKKTPAPDSPVFCFQENKLLFAQTSSQEIQLPTVDDLKPEPERLRFAFDLDDTDYYLLMGQAEPRDAFVPQPQSSIQQAKPQHLAFACATAASLYRWYMGNRFCGGCGTEMTLSNTERALVCPKCGRIVYPKICPAIIAAVTDGERLLLTRYAGRAFKRYALVAGFNEIGESIEDTVQREVMEETGLRVKNLRFYKSQPWVFTDSLLMGFYVDLDGSDKVTLQTDELCEGTWFHRSQLPEDHSRISLTGEMIEVFRQGRNP